MSAEETILDVKQKIENQMKVPVSHQKLIQVGRTLLDNKTVGSYDIKEGSKLTLVLKQPDSLKDAIYKQFRKYFNERQSEKLTNDFMDHVQERNKYLSLDDIERLAVAQLPQDLQSKTRPDVLSDYFSLEGPSNNVDRV